MPRPKRGNGIGATKRGKGTKWMAMVTGQGAPLGVQINSATLHEAMLIESMGRRIVDGADLGRIRSV